MVLKKIYFLKNQLKIVKSLLSEISLKDFLKLIVLNFTTNILDLFSISFICTFIFSKEGFFNFNFLGLSKFQLIFILFLILLFRSLIPLILVDKKEEIIFNLNKKLRNDFFYKFIYSNSDHLNDLNRSEFFSIINVEIDRTAASLSRTINLIQTIISAIIYTIAILLIGKTKIVFILLTFISLISVSILYKSKSLLLGSQESEVIRRVQRVISDGVYALKSVKAANAEKWILSKYTKENDRFYKILKKNIFRTYCFNSLKDFLAVFFVTAWMIINQSEFKLLDLSIILICTIKLSNFSGAIVLNYREFINLLPGYLKLIKFRDKLKFDKIPNKSNFLKNNEKYPIKNSINFFIWENSEISRDKVSKLIVEKNNPLIIVGKSGVGKTNLIDLVCGLKNTKSSSWEINFDKSMVRKLYNDLGAIEFRKHISYIPQDSKLFEMTIKQNILMQNYSNNIEDGFIDKLIINWIKKLNLSKVLSRYGIDNKIVKSTLDDLSRGEIQRIALIRSFLQNKFIEIYDEPLTGLDSINAKNIINIIEKRSKEKIIIIATHDVNLMKISTNILGI